MKRFIAILTLALTAALSTDEAFAQQGNSVPNATLSVIQTGESGMDGIAGILHVQIEDSGGSTDLYSPDTVDGIIAIIALAATETGLIDPDDCPRIIDVGECDEIMDPDDCPNLVDLWFELVDAGYTEDEAFEMIEMVMGDDMGYACPNDRIRYACPNDRMGYACPNDRMGYACPNDRIRYACPNDRIRYACPNDRIRYAYVNDRWQVRMSQ